MEKINIFFIHKGYQPHLKVSIYHAKKSNPDATIILLGDETNKFLANQLSINHFYIKDYFNQANEFDKIYKHVSKNNSLVSKSSPLIHQQQQPTLFSFLPTQTF